MTRSVRGLPKLGRNTLQRVKVDSVRPNLVQQLGGCQRRRLSFLSRSLVPLDEWEKNLHTPAVKLLHHLAECRNASWKITKQVELVATIDSKVRIDVPNQYRVDGSDAAFSLVQEPVNCVLGVLKIVEIAVPDQELDLRKNVLRPLQLRPLELAAIVANASAAIRSPRLQLFKPSGAGGCILRTWEKNLARSWQLG